MYDSQVLLGKLAIGAAGTVAALFLCRWPPTFAIPDRAFSRLALTGLAGSRLAVWLILYVGLGQAVPSDVPIAYVPQGQAVLAGGVVYLDFPSSYGPLFPYVIALALSVSNSAKAIVLLTIAVECLALPIWIAAARRCVAERVVRVATILYVTSALAIVMNPIGGSNQVWIMLCVGLAWWLTLRARDGWSGLTMAAGVLAVKALAGLFVPAIWLAARRRRAWTLACVAPLVVVYGALVVAGADVLLSVRWEASLTTSGNLPFLLRFLGMPGEGAWAALPAVVLGLVLSAVCLQAWRHQVARDPSRVAALMTLLLLVFLVISRKSYPNYLAMGLFPLCLTFAARPATRARVAAISGFMAIATIEPSLYFRWFGAAESLWSPGGHTSMAVATILTVDTLLVAGYIWIGMEAWLLAFDRPMAPSAAG
jgi:hypothetical protein